MVSGELDLVEGTLSAFVDADKLLEDGDKTIAKRKKTGKGAISLEKQDNKLIFTYINYDVGKTVFEYYLSNKILGFVDVEISWSVNKQKINLFVDGELERSVDMNVKDDANLNSLNDDKESAFDFFSNGRLL